MLPTSKEDGKIPSSDKSNKPIDLSLTDFREKYIAAITNTIEDKEFVQQNCIQKNRKGFTRKRKISFIHLIILLTQGLSRSIQRELNTFYQKLKGGDFSIQEVSKGAFTHARAKLNYQAFIKLNQIGNETFYKEAPYLKWQGFRLLAVDGSTIMLPNHPTVVKEFGTTGFGPSGDTQRPLARISMLYDVLNFTTLDASISSFTTSERELAKDHINQLTPGLDMLIMDRGYPSLSLMFELQQKKIDFCIRLHDQWWLEVKNMVDGGEKDKIVTFKLKVKDLGLLKKYGGVENKIVCRLVIVDLPDGGTEVLCTSVLDNERLPFESFATLYHYRWNIEEGYKLYKSRIQLEAFSGKTANAVYQDFFAKVFMMTTTAVMAFPIEEKLKKEQQQSLGKKKNMYKVNRTNALAMVKEIAGKVLITKKISQALHAFDDILSKTMEIVRPNRRVPRKKNSKKQPPSMNYKQL